MCRTERILHLSSSVTISEVIVKPEAMEGRLRGQEKEDSQRKWMRWCNRCVHRLEVLNVNKRK